MFRSAHDAFARPSGDRGPDGGGGPRHGGDGPSLYQMMEHVGHSLALTALVMATVATPIVMLAGTGGNGVRRSNPDLMRRSSRPEQIAPSGLEDVMRRLLPMLIVLTTALALAARSAHNNCERPCR